MFSKLKAASSAAYTKYKRSGSQKSDRKNSPSFKGKREEFDDDDDHDFFSLANEYRSS